MWKKWGFALLTAVLLCGPVLIEEVLGAPAKEKIRLTAISCWPKGDFLNTFYEKWINEVNNKAKGELEIQFVGGSDDQNDAGNWN